jgi:hypothetical protein
MILDELNEFADAVAISTTGTGTFLIGDQIPLSVARNIGVGDNPYLVIGIDTAVTSTGSATVKFHLVSDAQAAISTTGGATVHYSSAAIAKASLTAGTQVCAIKLPSSDSYETYLGVLAEVGTAKLSAGKINAYLTMDPTAIRAYSDGI